MCRFVAYLGEPISFSELLINPRNSLVKQSYDAEEMKDPLNGDGFGLGWYARHIRRNPGLFRSVLPAWNNQNLLNNADLIQTDCLFAHVRAASEGSVSEHNCHPFTFRHYLMMQNGGIPSFKAIKRSLIRHLSDEAFHWIKGQTDTEHIFALWMDCLGLFSPENGRALSSKDVAEGFRKTFQLIDSWKLEAGIDDKASTFNMMITDGERLFGTRYSSDHSLDSKTLYYSTGTRYHCEDGVCRMVRENGSDKKAVLVVSEKLSDVTEDWHPVPENHFIAVEKDHSVTILPLD